MVCSEEKRIILVRAEHPYVQSTTAHVTGTVCSRGYRWTREGADPRSLVEGLKSDESLFNCSAMWLCLSPWSCVALCSPFNRRRRRCRLHQKKRRERKREKIEEKKPSGTATSFFSFMRVPRDAVDGDGDGSMSGSCSPLVLCLDIISWS